MKKEKIYLTHLVLHTREKHPTPNFSKVSEKGRFYTSLHNESSVSKSSNIRRALMQLPQDIQERLSKGEIEILVPTDGLYVYADTDVYEKIKHKDKKERIRLMHNGRTFHAE